MRWHNLYNDPTDLPGNTHYVWTNVGAGYYEDGWYDDYGKLKGVVAWCEPKLDENECNLPKDILGLWGRPCVKSVVRSKHRILPL